MALLISDRAENVDPSLGSAIAVHLREADIALVIDALLQAEMTLPLLDPRYRTMKSIDHLRARQLALADQLEGLIANERCARAGKPGVRARQLEE